MKVNFMQNEQLIDNLIVLQAKQMNVEIEQIIRNIENKPRSLTGTLNDRTLSQPTQNFVRIYTAQKKVFGVTLTEEIILNSRLYELEAILTDNFIRISNTEIINIHYLDRLELTKNGIINIHFKNNEQTSSSRRYLPKIKERLL